MQRFIVLTCALAILFQWTGWSPALADGPPTPELNKDPRSHSTTIIQATCLGAGVALITTGIIFDGKESGIQRLWVEDGSRSYVDVPMETGADTRSMFIVGAIFMGLALVFEFLPVGSDLDDYDLSESEKESSWTPLVRTAQLVDGSSAIGLAKSFW